MNSKNYFFALVFLVCVLVSGLTTALAAPVQSGVSQKTIAFLPVLQVSMERETGISQILTNEVTDFAAGKKAGFVDDALLATVLEKHRYAQLDPRQPLDPALIKKIQQDTGADLVVAVRVESLAQEAAAGSGSASALIMVRPSVKMQLVAASAGQEKAWGRKVELDEVVDYSQNGEFGPEALAARKFAAFLKAAWGKL